MNRLALLTLALSLLAGCASTTHLRGTVKNAFDQPVEHAAILFNQRSAEDPASLDLGSTDTSGAFAIDIPDHGSNAILIFEASGYRRFELLVLTAEERYDDQGPLQIVLQPQASAAPSSSR